MTDRAGHARFVHRLATKFGLQQLIDIIRRLAEMLVGIGDIRFHEGLDTDIGRREDGSFDHEVAHLF